MKTPKMTTDTTATSSSKNGVSRPRKRSRIRDEVLDEILALADSPEDIKGPDGVLQELIGALVSRAMKGEMSSHLGYAKGEEPPEEQSNRRNGNSSKKLRTSHGVVDIEVPRDREGSYEPQIVGKHERDFAGFDDQILSMYARGMSVRDIRRHLGEIYNVEVSTELISRVTDEVVDELRAWQSRPLEAVYLVVYLDALVVKTRDKTGVRNKSVYLAVGLKPDGEKDILGMWMEATEGAKYWLSILSELRQRGVQDIFILCADGLTGLPEAVAAAFPEAVFQTCIVHMIRQSTRFVPWKDRKTVCRDLRAIYTAATVEDAAEALDEFDEKWGQRFPMIAKSWRKRWEEITPFLAYPPEIRKVVYTTNAIEALNRQVRKVIKTRGHMPNDDAAMKLIYLALRNASQNWGQKNKGWITAMQQFAIYFEERMPIE